MREGLLKRVYRRLRLTADQAAFNARRADMAELPSLIYIETTMACNFDCVFCPVPTSRQSMGRRPQVMSRAVFEATRRAISDRPRTISLTLMGEPLMHKRIVEFVGKLKADGHRVQMVTNGSLLDEEKSRALLEAGIDTVVISFDGGNKATYEHLRIGGDFAQVVANVRRFDKLRKKIRPQCRLDVFSITSDVTRGQEKEIKALWKGVADNVSCGPLSDWQGQLELPAEFGPAYEPPQPAERYACHLLWTSVAVTASGQVSYCCHDYKLRSALPNVVDKDLREIWADDIGVERARHARGDYRGSPCESCGAWKHMPEFYGR